MPLGKATTGLLETLWDSYYDAVDEEFSVTGNALRTQDIVVFLDK